MTATVTVQPNGFSVQYPKTQWRVIYVEHSSGKFYFRLSSQEFWFEPRDRYRYPSHDDAKRAAHCFLELMKRLGRSRMKLSVLAEIGILKFPQQVYRSCELWLLIDRTRYTWEIFRTYATVTCERLPKLDQGHWESRTFKLFNQIIGKQSVLKLINSLIGFIS